MITIQECLYENNRRHRKRCGERVTKSQMKQENRAHSSGGKASRGRINAIKCRNDFGSRPDVRIIACVSQQTDGWNNSHKGARILERVPSEKKLDPAWFGTGRGLPVFPGLPLCPSPSTAGNTLKPVGHSFSEDRTFF